MTTIPDTILIACLDALENGGSAAEIMSRYPEYAAELRPFLDTAVMLNELPPPPPEIAAELSKKAFLQEAATMKTAVAPQPARRSWFQLLRPVLALGLVLIAFSVTMVAASASAVPGDVLYTTKRFVEDVRLSRADDAAERESLLERLQQERIREVNSLLTAGRSENVAFTGKVEAIADAQWVINGVLVKISPDTDIIGTAVQGAEAEVNGRIENGMLTAITITLPDTELPETEPTATQEQPTVTPLPPTATPVPPTKTATPSPTPNNGKELPKPTATADAGDNENEADDNDNESEIDDNAGGNDDDDAGDNNNDSGSDDDNNNDDHGGNDNDDDNANDDDDDDNSNSGDDSGSGGGGDDDNANDDDDNSNSGGGDDDNANDDDDDSNDNDDDEDDSDNDNDDDDSNDNDDDEDDNDDDEDDSDNDNG